MLHVVLAVVSLQLGLPGVTVKTVLQTACRELGINYRAEMTVPAALKACNEAMGIDQHGSLIEQVDLLAEQLGLSFEDPSPQLAVLSPPEDQVRAAAEGASAGTCVPEDAVAAATADGTPPAATQCLSVHEVMSALAMVHKFSAREVPDELVARAMECQFWAPNHKLKGSWRFLQLGPESRLAAAQLSAQQASGKTESRMQALERIPGCLVVVCGAFYQSDGRVEKEEQRTLTAVHNLALGLASQGLGVKWVTGACTENYELWELIELDPNKEVVVGLLWYGWPAVNGTRPVRDQATVQDKLFQLP
jgi:nitroreductase